MKSNKSLKNLIGFIILMALFVLPTKGFAQMMLPSTINYQGYLTDSSGAMDGTVTMTFNIYDVDTGGVTLWRETHSSVMVTQGVYSVVLGFIYPIDLTNDRQYYLGVTVGTDAEMMPRQEFPDKYNGGGIISLPKTGQTTCYGNTAGNPEIPCTGTGQDGETQSGVAWPNPRFTLGTGAESDCIMDNLTGLMWPRNGNLVNNVNWYDALDFANNLELCGYSDWHLPNINELESLVNAEEVNISTWLNSEGFINIQPNDYWSATSNAMSPYQAYYVSFLNGQLRKYYSNGKLNHYDTSVLAARTATNGSIQLPKTGQTKCYGSTYGNPEIPCTDTGQDGETQSGVTWPAPRFTLSENCVIDNLTGLLWLQDAYASGGSWYNALDYTNDLTLCGYSDWRLPNTKELRSLIDYSSENDYLPSGHPFLNTTLLRQRNYWTSTTDSNSPGFAKIAGSQIINAVKGSREPIWPVRGGQIGSYGGLNIAGTVTNNSSGLQGVTMTLSGASSKTTTTASNGTYTFSSLGGGSYTISPNLSGYTFNPISIDIILGASVIGQDFRACDTSVPLAGHLYDATTNSPLYGITIRVDGSPAATTNATGYYEISGLSCGTHEITVDGPSEYVSYTRTMDTSENTIWDIYLTKPETALGPDTDSGESIDPVNTATGNYFYQRKDLVIPGKGLPFLFERIYNSKAASESSANAVPLGYGWDHSYNVKLRVNADSSITLKWGDGKTETWTPDGGGGFTAQYGVFDTLIDNGDSTYALMKKNLTQYNFDLSGQLSGITDENGNTISMTYTGVNLTQVTDTAGRNVAITYDASNRITLITDSLSRAIQFSYDANGDLVSAINMNGNITTYTYDSQHQLASVLDPRGNTVVTNVYDALNRVVTSQSDAKGGATTYTYEEVNKKTTIIDQLGYTTTHYHDSLLRLIQETNHLGDSAYYTYDSAGNRTQVADKNGNITQYAYDASGNVISKTDSLGNVTTITYDANNNPLTRTDVLGNTMTFAYDTNGNLISTTDAMGNVTTITYDPNGQPLTITDPLASVTTNTYDAEGNLGSVTDALGNVTTFTYDGVGRRLTETDSLGRTGTTTYDNNNTVLSVIAPLGNVTTTTYDANGNRISMTDSSGNTTTYSYDVKDLLETVTDPLGNSISYSYDGLDRRISSTDRNGNVTNFTYDSTGNLLSLIDALGNVTSFTYDAKGNKLTETDPLGNTTIYNYDALDRLVSVTDPLGNVMTNAHDALGRIVQTINANGQTKTFEYDALGRLTLVIDAAGGTVSYTYDVNGSRLSMTDPNGNTTVYTYDALNRLVQKAEPLGNTHQYAYDAVGNRISLTDAKGNTMSYSYDANDRLVLITYPDASTVTFAYDVNGNRITMIDGLGTSLYTYDALNRMLSYTDPFGKTVGYEYDANGNRVSMIYPDARVVSYSYDARNRMETVTDWLGHITDYFYAADGKLITTINPNNTTTTYTYDTASRLTGLLNAKSDASVISSYSFTLDNVGNHITATKDEPLLPTVGQKNITYLYDAENRMTLENGILNTYDANGNMTLKASDSFTYDYEDRLTQSIIGGVISNYQYDGLGNRLEKTEDTVATRYVLDVNANLTNIIAETNTTGIITNYYVYGLGLISKILPNDDAYYYHYDSRGSTIALSDSSENLTDKYAYDTFGNLANVQGTTENPYMYVGRYGVMDEGNGLNFIRARYYSPDIGRFITKDTMTGNDIDGQSLNRYIYALNNPVRLVDVTGFSAQEGGVNENYHRSSDSDIYNNLLLEIDEIQATFLLGTGKLLSNIAMHATEWKIVHVTRKSGKTFWRKAQHVGRAGKFAKGLEQVTPYLRVAELYYGGYKEYKRRGYDLDDLQESVLDIGENLKFAIENPDAALDAVTEGVTSTTAVFTDVVTLGLFDITGEKVEKFADDVPGAWANALDNIKWGWGKLWD